jgi:hypothetical protein
VVVLKGKIMSKAPMPKLRAVPVPRPIAKQELDYEYEERAAIREYDGHFPRPIAEILAKNEIKGGER